MKIVIWPRTDGDVITDYRLILQDGVLVPALVVVDDTGAEITPGLSALAQLRDGGGHVEFFRMQIQDGLGFEKNAGNQVLSYPDGN